MAVIEYRKVKCDECGKEVEIKDEWHLPHNWLEISVMQWLGGTGIERLTREVCSEKCALKLIRKLKRLPKRKPARL